MSELNLKCPADFNHNCPGDWDDDYKSIWVQLQVQQHNKMQYRKAWKEAQSELTAARDEAERLRAWVDSEVVSAIMVAGREFGHRDLTYSELRMFAEDYAQRLRQQAQSIERGE